MKILTLSPRQKIVLAALLYIILMISYTYFSVLMKKDNLYKQLDRELENAALTAPSLLPPTLHHQAMQQDDVTIEQNHNNIQSLSAFTDQQDIIYIYTLILRGNKVLFTSSSATQDERKSGEGLSFYFDHYSDVDPRVVDAFKTKQKTFIEYTDQWGTFRSVFIPSYSTDGTFYLTAADLSISHIEALLNQNIYRSIATAILFLLFAYPLYLAATYRGKHLVKELDEKVQQQTYALKASEERLKQAFTASNQGWFDLNVQTGVLSVSPEYVKMIGYEPDDFHSNLEEWKNHLHPDDLASVMTAFQECMTTGGPQTMEYRRLAHNGEWEWIRSVGKITEWTEDKQPLRMMGIHTCITERKKAEEQLRESEQRLRLSQLYGGIGTWEADFLTNTEVWSEAVTQQLGFPDLAEPTWDDFVATIHPDDRGHVLKEIDLHISEAKELNVEYQIIDTQGEIRWMRSIGKAEFDSDGNPINMRGTVQEITDQKQADHHLRIAATAFESQEGMMVTDADNIILRVNKAFTTITGYNVEEAIGNNPRMLSSGQHDAVFYEEMWKAINTTDYWEGEVWNKRKNGDEYPEQLTITAVKDSDGIVTNYVGTITDITLSKQAEQEIEDLAYYDPLTHLPNRRLMIDRIHHAMAASARSNHRGALLFLDLDHFKDLNDTLGHDMGDLLLQKVAERLTGCIREGDTVSRFGGDEFVVLLEDLSHQSIEAATQTEDIANKVLSSINRPYQLASHHYTCSTSIGITLFDGHQSIVEELLKQADIAMYQAKDDGRNVLRFFDPKMQATITARTKLEKELIEAIEQQQFQLYYQLQVDSSQTPVGAEALIRWQHPERGLVSPLDFISIAEQTGTILEIGQWVLDTACAQLKTWQQNELTRDLTLSVNVSAKQFRQADFISQVMITIQQHDIHPSRLKLELTESLLLDDTEEMISKMKALSDIGIQFSLDDFGTGYSSLQYLKQLPLYQLKIDKSFVDDLNTDSNDQVIVRTIISMAYSLGLGVIAEGVETKEQQQRLLAEGCTHYQGYLYSKPVPIEEFEAFLRKS